MENLIPIVNNHPDPGLLGQHGMMMSVVHMRHRQQQVGAIVEEVVMIKDMKNLLIPTMVLLEIEIDMVLLNTIEATIEAMIDLATATTVQIDIMIGENRGITVVEEEAMAVAVAVMITIVAAECLVMNNPMIEKSSSMAQRLRTELVQVERRTTGKKVTIKNILEIVIVEGAHLRLIGTAMGVVTIEVGKEKEGSIMGPAVVGDIQDLIIKI